jgi:hypothetical protein
VFVRTISKRIILVFIFGWLNSNIYAQIVHSNNKKYFNKVASEFGIEPSIGIGFTPKIESFNAFGESKQIFNGFSPIFSSSFGLNIQSFKKLSTSLQFTYGNSTKVQHKLNFVGLSINMRYHLFRIREKKINLYAIGGLSLINGILERESFSVQVLLDTLTKKISETSNKNTQILNKKFKAINSNFFFLQPTVGVGINYQLDYKHSLFAECTMNFGTGNSFDMQSNFPNNHGVLNFTNLKVGIAIQLLKPKPIFVDTNPINVKDEIILLEIPDKESAKILLVREGKFDVSLREGIKHTSRIKITGNKLSVNEIVTDNCIVEGYLYDSSGKLVGKTESTPDGRMTFHDINPGNYELTFVLQKPCKTASLTYKFPDPSLEILEQFTEEGIVKDTSLYMIEGEILVGDAAYYDFLYHKSELFLNDDISKSKNRGITVYLVDSKNKVVKKMNPNTNQVFYFDKLTSKDFRPIYLVPTDEVDHSGMAYVLVDGFYNEIQDFPYAYKDSISNFKKDIFIENLKSELVGKVTVSDNISEKFDCIVHLVNRNSQIVASQKLNKDGVFRFKNLKSKMEYEIVVENPDSSNLIEVVYKIEENLLRGLSSLNDSKSIIPNLQFVANSKIIYALSGQIVHISKFSLCVGAFEKLSNCDFLVKKLQKLNIEPIYIQPIYSEDISQLYKNFKNLKLYRILVGNFETVEKSIKTYEKIKKLGITCYLISNK